MSRHQRQQHGQQSITQVGACRQHSRSRAGRKQGPKADGKQTYHQNAQESVFVLPVFLNCVGSMIPLPPLWPSSAVGYSQIRVISHRNHLRRLVCVGDCLTKVYHTVAPPNGCCAGVIQTDNYFSAWRCRTVPSPWEEEAPSLGGSSNCSNGMPQLTIKTTQGGQSAGDIGGSRKPACELILL